MRSLVNTVLAFLAISVSLSEVNSLKILGIFPHPGKSHFFVFETYLRELARRGHDVTVISHFPQKTPAENYTDISIAGSVEILEDVIPIEKSYASIVKIVSFIIKSGSDNCEQLLSNNGVQKLWKTQANFDVILVELFNSDCSLGLAYKLGGPVVGLTSHTLMPWHFSRFGISLNPSYVSNMFSGAGTKPTLYQRMESTIFNAYFNNVYKWLSQRVDQNTLAKYFDNVPPLEDLSRDIKLLLLYQNSILFRSSMFPENVKEVGGYHVASPKPLPDNIEKFIEDSEHGVIYISFGSMIKATTLPKDKLEAIMAALSELPQRVIWKWEAPSLPGHPKNIYISNWLPQNDLLAHPKVLAFYSHCGMLGTTEAIHHGVPIVGMPIFGDQPSNAKAVEENGLGVQIEVNELTKDNLLNKFKTVLDPGFRLQVKLISKAWHDRPISAMDSAIFWTEFAARNGNFTFRYPAVDVPIYQYFNLDILAIFTLTFVVMFFVVKFIFTLQAQTRRNNKKSKKV